MNEILDYLESKSIFYKREGRNEAIINCPVCHRDKLYINLNSGAYHCFYCQDRKPYAITARGHFAKLKEILGDIVPISGVSSFNTKSNNQEEKDYTDKVARYHRELFNNKKALLYLKERGLTEETVERFKLGFVHFEKQDWLSIPSYEDGLPKLIKYRKLPPDTNKDLDKYIRETGAKSILFNGDILDDDEIQEIYICEGELDAISMLQAGYDNVIGITGGAGTLLPSWYDKLVLKDNIYLIFDNDERGQKDARDIWARRLGTNKCWNVVLPKGEDVNSFLKDNSKEELDEYIKSAAQFKIEGISHIEQVGYELHERIQNRTGIDVFPLPWYSVNKLLGGGLAKQRLTVLGGFPKSGKTSLAVQVCYYLAKNYNIPSLIWCLEMPETDLVTKVIQLEADITVEEVHKGGIFPYMQKLKDLPMYFAYKAKTSPEIFYNTIKEARNRYGIELGVFDNLQAMVRTGQEADIGNASKMFKDITMELNIMFILVSQPRKPTVDDNYTITYNELKGSSAMSADADEIILLYRKRLDGEQAESTFSPITSVIVDASRYAPGGKTTLLFHGEKSRFDEK